MEYILFQMINSKIEYCIDNKTSTIAMLPAAEREYLLEIFKKEYDTYEEALEILENLEDLQAYPDFLFEDYDFNLLDEMSEEELIPLSAQQTSRHWFNRICYLCSWKDQFFIIFWR